MQKYGGISRYFYEILNNLHQQEGVQVLFPLVFSENKHLLNGSFYSNRVKIPSIKFPFRRNVVKYLNHKSLKASCSLADSQDFDIYHPTYYDPYLLPSIINKPFILTIHDMIHEIFFLDSGSDEKTSEQKKRMAEMATRIITVSNHSKSDIMQYLGISEAKIDVIYLSNSFNYNNNKSDEMLPSNYLLFVGKRNLYKNFHIFIKSVVPLLKKDNSLFIIAAGAKPFTRLEKIFLKEIGIASQVLHLPVYDDYDLSTLYSNAKAFVFPSLYEGFGIPVLEAFACQCPAIISHTSSLIEVGGDAVMFFDPESHDSIRNAVSAVVYGESKRKELIQKGVERIKLFSWEETARETLAAYRRAI